MSTLLASLFVALAPGTAGAGPTAPDTLQASAALAGATLAAWAGSETILKGALAPSSCHWCDRSLAGADTLNRIDRWGLGARWPVEHRPAADLTSSILAFGALPAFLLAFELLDRGGGPLSRLLTDAVLTAEAVGLAVLVDQFAKFYVARARPYVHDLSPGSPALSDVSGNLSFFSGHATFAFAMTAAIGTLAVMRGSRYAWLVWAIGLPVAVGVSYLRMAADLHYLTDVAVGAAVGSLYGAGVPLLHGRLASGPGSVSYTLTF